METKIYIKKTRKKTGLSQRKFGQKLWPKETLAKVGDRISKYETGAAMPPGQVILKIQIIYSDYIPKLKG